ncbi:MAG: hypothetical protein IPK13_02450 [Deltaproteobacteria bacterium]|nr:hypothetical protein [Deltaproteobacteria bacterium]
MMPESLSTAFWIGATLVAFLYTALLRLAVRVSAKEADNGWDNAIGYSVVTILLAFLAGWILESRNILLILLIVPTHVLIQTLAIRVIYEVRYLRALLIGACHALMASLVIGGLATVAGFIAALILKKRIIADPIYFIRLLLRLLGIELPFAD